MDASAVLLRALLLQKVMRRIPRGRLNATLEKWGRLPLEQRESLDFTLSTRELTETLLNLCEEHGFSVKHIAGLEMTYVMDFPEKKKWHALHLQNQEDFDVSADLTHFKETFKAHLTEVTGQVCLNVRKHTDDAIWIRIAWGGKRSQQSQPNHLNAVYIVHYLQTPYAFTTTMTSQQKLIICQALGIATRFSSVKDANLTGMSLTAIKDLLMRNYQQVFPARHRSTFETRRQENPQIVGEQLAEAEMRHELACEAFGHQELPQLQTVVYKLETKFKDDTHTTEDPIRCNVKFSSTNVLESLRDCAQKGIVSTPVSHLLSLITREGRNVFHVTDTRPRGSQQDADRTNP